MSKNRKKTLEGYSKKTQRKNERISKKIMGKKALAGALVSFGMAIGIIGTNQYNQTKNNGIDKHKNAITIDASKLGINEINVKNKKYRDTDFINEIKVTVDGKKLDIVKDVQEENVKEATIREINKLKTEEQVINYIKEIYSEEYNKINNDKIGKNDITLYRDPYMVRLDEDIAKNGDKILRIAEGHKVENNRYNFPKGVIRVQINTNRGIITENMVEKDGKYFTVYDMNQKVKKYKENIATRIGGILDYGILVADSKEKNILIKDEDDEKSYNRLVLSYENKLIDEVCKRKNSQIRELQGIDGEEQETESGR
ncbi:MAG: hypothetical protein HFJ40_03580 [Clostridia bacterium]|nr:hypothetical protein [Clostridia bacterium]